MIKTNSLLILLSTFFLSCGENTTVPIIPDIKSLEILNSDMQIHSTDGPTNVYATVTYTDNSSADVTNDIKWVTDLDILHYEYKTIWGGTSNGGMTTLTASHSDLNNSINVEVISLTSFKISSTDINTTGEHILTAVGYFDNNATDSKVIVKNIVWSADNGAVITSEDDIFTIDIQNGDTNITATLFEDTNTSSPIAPQSILFSIN